MNENTSRNPLLETAWRRYAALDDNASSVKKQYMRMRWLATLLGVLAVLFAILVDKYTDQVPAIAGIVLRVLLILTPIVISVIAAYSNKFQQGQNYLSYRAAAEGILKEIYIYRTANKKEPNRDSLLSNRLAGIQRDLYRGAGGELVLPEYEGDVPPYYSPDDEKSDPGFKDLAGEEYLVYRLENQLNWHTMENLKMQRDRKRIQWAILTFGGVGAFLAAWGGNLAVWVAFTAAISSALIGWDELRGLDIKVRNYSQVILELNLLRDRWFTLRDTGSTDDITAQLAIKAERILFDQNLEWVSAIRKALAEAEGNEVNLEEHFIGKDFESDAQFQERFFSEVQDFDEEGIGEAVERVEAEIDDADDSLTGVSAGITTIDEDKEDTPLEESLEESEVMFFDPADDFRTLEHELIMGESTTDSAMAVASIFSRTSEEGISEGFSDEALEAEEFVADEVGEALGEDFEDEDFGDAEFDDGGEFVDEDFGEQEDEFDDEGDFEEEVWDDEA